jgi:hypothetical protein
MLDLDLAKRFTWLLRADVRKGKNQVMYLMKLLCNGG